MMEAGGQNIDIFNLIGLSNWEIGTMQLTFINQGSGNYKADPIIATNWKR